jgi:hypothetical protein
MSKTGNKAKIEALKGWLQHIVIVKTKIIKSK